MMGCLGVIAAVILFSSGIDMLNANVTLGLILIGAAIAVGVVTWLLDYKTYKDL